jgi:hypothetical protein
MARRRHRRGRRRNPNADISIGKIAAVAVGTAVALVLLDAGANRVLVTPIGEGGTLAAGIAVGVGGGLAFNAADMPNAAIGTAVGAVGTGVFLASIFSLAGGLP